MKKAFDFVRRQFTWPELAMAAVLFMLMWPFAKVNET